MTSTEEFLEHHGVKGQQWGVRNLAIAGMRPSSITAARQVFNPKSSKNVNYTPPKIQRKTAFKILGGAAAIATVGAGALYASKHMGIPTSSFNTPVASGRIKDGSFLAKSMMRQIGQKRMSDLPTLNELRYSPHWFQFNKMLEFAVDATQSSLIDDVFLKHERGEMSTDTLNTFLKYQGFSDEATDDFLEHFGKKGMQWGRRSKIQKAGITGAALLTGAVGQGVAMRFGARKPGVLLGASAASIAVGALATGRMLDRQGRTKLSDAKTKTSKHRSATTAEKTLMITTGAAYVGLTLKGMSMMKKQGLI